MIDIDYQPQDVVLTIPKPLASSNYVQQFLQRLAADAALANSQAGEHELRQLAEEIDNQWWLANKEQFLGQQ